MLPAGKSLRTLREKMGLTMRDVETSSARIAEKYRNEELSIPPSRLSDIETKGLLPSIYRLYTLSVIYRRDLKELLAWYGVDLNNTVSDLSLVSPPRSHVSEVLVGTTGMQVPLHMDPAFDSRRTTHLGRMVEQWGLVPLSYLSQFATSDFTYGYVGSQDFTCTQSSVPEALSKWTRRAIKSRKGHGDQSTNVPSILSRPATGLSVAGVESVATTSFCSRILCRRCRSGCSAIPRMRKLWVKWWAWPCN